MTAASPHRWLGLRRLLAVAAGLAQSLPGDQQDGPAIWDYVVVGAGTGGGLCAGRLAQAGYSVLLLEAGAWEQEWLYNQSLALGRTERGIDWNYPTRFPSKLTVQNSAGRKKRIVAGKTMGGSSAVHGDVYDKAPITELQIQGLSDWTPSRVDAAFERIESSLTMSYIGFNSFDDIPESQAHIASLLEEQFPLTFFPRGPPRVGSKAGLASGWMYFRQCTAAPADCTKKKGCHPHKNCTRFTSYKDMVASQNSSRITVVSDALVSRVLIEEGQAVGVELIRSDSRGVLEVFAQRAVVLAAGALGTPKILMLSGIGDPLELQRVGVPVRVANREVGQNLADHLAHFTWFILGSTLPLDSNNPACQHHEMYNVFYNNTGSQDGDGPLDSEVRFYGGCNFERNTYDFGIEAVLLHPKSRGRVALTSADPKTMPVAEYPQLWEEDFDNLERVIARLGESMGLKPNEMVSSVGMTLAEDVRQKAYLYQHLCCSARASAQGEPGVLDQDLSVRGISGLFVADASALPAPPSGHTSAAALLVGEFASEAALVVSPRTLPSRAAQTSRSRVLNGGETAKAISGKVATPVVTVRTLRRENPLEMPLVALGTGTLAKQKVSEAVSTFLHLGGRHLDTAAMYENYAEVKEGIETSGLRDLSDIVITCKVMPLGREHVKRAVQDAMDGLNFNGIDIMLLHWPGDNSDGKLLHGAPLPACADRFLREGAVTVSWRRCRVESYKALLEEQSLGRVQVVGVSNFAARHLVDLRQEGLDLPAVHQMEFHPAWHEESLLEQSFQQLTSVQAYACLGGAVNAGMLLRTEAIQKSARRYGKSPAQVLHRWALQRGVAVITGGSSAEHIHENLDLFGFSIEESDMDWLNQWLPTSAQKKSYGPLPDDIL